MHKIPNILEWKVSEIIIDLEDAVKHSERAEIITQLISGDSYKDYYIRVPLYNERAILDTNFFRQLYAHGFRKFVFPKIQKAADFDTFISEGKYTNIKGILLVETSRCFLEAKDLLLKYQNLFTGIGLGSHDFMAEVGGVHNLENLAFARLQIIYLARMVNIKAIDIASMELKDGKAYKDEIIDGFNKGYDAKFFIHPWQINLFQSISLYEEDEWKWALKVNKAIAEAGSAEEFSPIVIDGQIIERPHLAKAEKIIKYYVSK